MASPFFLGATVFFGTYGLLNDVAHAISLRNAPSGCGGSAFDEALGGMLGAAFLGGIESKGEEEAGALLAEELTRVGRWMSKNAFEMMLSNDKVIEGSGGRTSVTVPPSPTSYIGAPPGSVYVEFNLPSNVLLQGGNPDWFFIPGPNLNTLRCGPKPLEMPPATCIVCVMEK